MASAKSEERARASNFNLNLNLSPGVATRVDRAASWRACATRAAVLLRLTGRTKTADEETKTADEETKTSDDETKTIAQTTQLTTRPLSGSSMASQMARTQ